MNIKYKDVYVIEDFDEAEQFRYEHDNQVVEVGTAVAYENNSGDLVCFEGIYFQSEDE